MATKPAGELTATVLAAWVTDRGQPDHTITFDHPAAVSALSVVVHRPRSDSAVTIFATVGMSTVPMPSRLIVGIERAELNFTRRGAVTPDDEESIARHLVTIAAYPWASSTGLEWDQLLPLDSDFPTLPGCRAVFVSGPLGRGDRTHIPAATGPIRVLTVVPVTAAEAESAVRPRSAPFLRRLRATVDIFDARPATT